MKTNQLNDKVFSLFEQKIRQLAEQTFLDYDFSIEGESAILRAKNVDKDYSPSIVFSRNLLCIYTNSKYWLPKNTEYIISIIDHFKKNTLSAKVVNETDVFINREGRVLRARGGNIQYTLPAKNTGYEKATEIMTTNFQQAISETAQRLESMPKTNHEPRYAWN